MKMLLLSLSLLLAPQSARPTFGTISGLLRDSNGAPAAGVRIGVTTAETTVGASTMSSLTATDPEGRYRLEDIPPGRYLILAGALASPTYFPGVTVPVQGLIVTVAAGQTIAGLDFAIAPTKTPPQGASGGGVPWIVRMDDGSPAPGVASDLSVRFVINGSGATICCRGGPQSGGGTPVTLRGLVPGANTVAVGSVPLGYYVKSMTFDGVDLTTVPLVLPAKAAGAQIEVVLTKTPPFLIGPRGFKVSGQVTNLELPRSSNITLMLSEILPTGGTVYIGTVANVMIVSVSRRTGAFEIEGLPSGSYTLQFDGSVGAHSSTGLTFEVAGRDVTNLALSFEPYRQPAKPETPVALNPKSVMSISGSVEGTDGAIPEFEIGFTATRGAGETHAARISGREFTVQLPEGEYRLSVLNLPQGYTMTSVNAGPLDLTEPFLVTGKGIADRFTGSPINSKSPAGAVITVLLKTSSAGK